MSDADGARTEIEEVRAWAAGLEALHARIAGRFARAERWGRLGTGHLGHLMAYWRWESCRSRT